MSSFYSNNLRVLVARKEETSGIPVTLTSADFDVRVRNPTVTATMEADDEASKYATGDHGEDVAVMGAQSASIEFSIKMSSTDGTTSPKWWKFAEACGCEIKTYENSSSTAIGKALQPRKVKDVSTMTINIYDIPRNFSSEAICYTFAGCMGNMTIGAEGVGKPWTANFSFTGKLVGMVGVQLDQVPELSIDDNVVAEKMLNYEMEFGTDPKKISTFQIDVGNEISPLLDQSDPTGYAYYSITKRSPRFSCNPLIDGNFDADSKLISYSNWKNETTFPVTLKSKVTGSGFTLYLPKTQQLTAGIANREGLVNWDLNLKALRRTAAEITSQADGMTGEDQEVTWELLLGKRVED